MMNLSDIRPVLARLAPVLVAALLYACAAPPLLKAPHTEDSYALAAPDTTTLGQRIAEANARTDADTGILLLDRGERSLILRAALVERSERTIDIQTFIWASDNIGTLAAEWLLRAADRGVRIRVIVDDFPLDVKREYLALLDAHPNVEIRIYNPLADPGASALQKIGGLLGSWSLKNRRMHNKVFIVDNSAAIVGGRNIADEYYDMNTEYNFRDRDVLVAGEVVRDLSNSFDGYWNSEWVLPVREADWAPDAREQESYYEALAAYARDTGNFPPRFYTKIERAVESVENMPGRLTWIDAEVLVDDPGKNPALDEMTGFGETGRRLMEVVRGVESEVLIESPYLILSDDMMAVFDGLRERGVEVRILTNSLESTDNIAAFAGYMETRKELLRKGVKLRELRVDADLERVLIDRYDLLDEHTRYSLHAKTAVFDRRWVFIGSFNLDPRSTHLNTEVGVLIDSPELARETARIVEQDMSKRNSWWITLEEDGRLKWTTDQDGEVSSFREPGKGFFDTLKLIPLRLLPVRSIL